MKDRILLYGNKVMMDADRMTGREFMIEMKGKETQKP